MNNPTPITAEKKFSKELIDDQLRKIFADPTFFNSGILKKFLSFIVDQTLAGHEHWLKEYTIAVNVLNKSADFKPTDNGIIRIHAGRLRRALNNYYNNNGKFDQIRISIPKGRYVPVFSGIDGQIATEELSFENNWLPGQPSLIYTNRKKAVIAVLPFQHFNNNAWENSLSDGLGLQLSNSLLQFEDYSVAAYYTVSDLWKKTADLSQLVSQIQVDYLLSGNIQSIKNKVRSNIHLMDCSNGMQLWGCMYECEFDAENLFNFQDEMVRYIIAELKNSLKLLNSKKRKTITVLG